MQALMNTESADPGHRPASRELQQVLRAEQSGMHFVLYRDDTGQQALQPFEAGGRATIGGHSASDVALRWDSEVSRAHAILEQFGCERTVIQDGDGACRPGHQSPDRAVTCRYCSAPVAAGQRFCRSCGTALAGAPVRPPPAAAIGDHANTYVPKDSDDDLFEPGDSEISGRCEVCAAPTAGGAPMCAACTGDVPRQAPVPTASPPFAPGRAGPAGPPLEDTMVGLYARSLSPDDTPQASLPDVPKVRPPAPASPESTAADLRSQPPAKEERGLSSQFREDASLEDWTSEMREKAPRVNLVRVQFLRALDGDNAEVAVEVVTRNADEAQCGRFDGRVRVVRENDVWRYWAGGRGDTFTRRETLPASDARCAPLVGDR